MKDNEHSNITRMQVAVNHMPVSSMIVGGFTMSLGKNEIIFFGVADNMRGYIFIE